jgi:hypothetical protein
MRWFLLAILLGASQAAAAPLIGKHARRMLVSVNHHRRGGLGVRPCSDGWHLRLAHSPNGLAELIDVSPRTPARTISQGLDGDELYLDTGRFKGGHVYQLQLRRGEAIVSRGYVYLYPRSSRSARDCPAPQRLVFGSAEMSEPGDDDGSSPAVVAKNTLR